MIMDEISSPVKSIVKKKRGGKAKKSNEVLRPVIPTSVGIMATKAYTYPGQRARMVVPILSE